MEMFYIVMVVVTQVYALKWMYFVVGKLYLNKVYFKEYDPGTNCSVPSKSAPWTLFLLFQLFILQLPNLYKMHLKNGRQKENDTQISQIFYF